ncbi:MAG: plasmid mobilization relaxosome protein MobC [Pseudomonadota bacterium]
MSLGQDFTAAAKEKVGGSASRQKRTRDCPRVTVRLSQEDHAKLTELADGTALSVYLRARALGQELPRRRAKGIAVEDRVAIAKILGLLGQSRIANNLNQLAYHANVGALDFDEKAQAQVEEAYELVVNMRSLLLAALGTSK